MSGTTNQFEGGCLCGADDLGSLFGLERVFRPEYLLARPR